MIAGFEFNKDFLALVNLAATVLFILGLKGLSSPKTARRGNSLAVLGMGLAVVATLVDPSVTQYGWVFGGLAAGAIVGTAIALRVQMTSMPQLVAVLHSFVGLSAVLVAVGMLLEKQLETGAHENWVEMLELGLGTAIGAITFTGSVIAFGKLQEILGSAPLVFRGQHLLNLFLGLAAAGLCGHFMMTGELLSFYLMTAISLALGFLLVLPIGGADMPVVVSMLNSYSGWAAAATGFTLGNPLLITTGALVGSSGAILSFIMCKAMNRSFFSVILGGFGAEASSDGAAADGPQKRMKSASVDDLAFMLENSSKAIIVPGYGMAVAQAQHPIKELYHELTSKGVEVKFAIHPVAGRMPGHMNVLLAEADIPYDCVFEMDEINNEFSTADVALIIGANDVVNPAAKTDKKSPLFGMPILDAYKAKSVYVSKRSMRAGYAGVDNDLFYYENCSLVFGDAKATCEGLVNAIKGATH
jgi:NAD(P) transhydrogenase subunit beta